MQASTAKAIAIVIVGAGEDTAAVRDIDLEPGLSIQDVLDSIGLPDYNFSRGKGQPLLDHALNLYNEVRPDDIKFYATPPPDQGC